MAEPVDPGIVRLLEYRPMNDSKMLKPDPGPYRPAVLIPGHKPYVSSREFPTFDGAFQWARGFIQKPGTFIKPGTTVRIGEKVLAVLPMGSESYRLQFLGARRPPGRP